MQRFGFVEPRLRAKDICKVVIGLRKGDVIGGKDGFADFQGSPVCGFRLPVFSLCFISGPEIVEGERDIGVRRAEGLFPDRHDARE